MVYTVMGAEARSLLLTPEPPSLGGSHLSMAEVRVMLLTVRLVGAPGTVAEEPVVLVELWVVAPLVLVPFAPVVAVVVVLAPPVVAPPVVPFALVEPTVLVVAAGLVEVP
jgi:hypothetical protein